jgi:hypothetical protein
MRADDLSPSNGKRISADRGPVCAATQPVRQPRPLAARYRLDRRCLRGRKVRILPGAPEFLQVRGYILASPRQARAALNAE